ncbi:MAG: VanW family protein [Chloroflexi bacterium]|nr:VanW family protein [Chloroflexota bacterium]
MQEALNDPGKVPTSSKLTSFSQETVTDDTTRLKVLLSSRRSALAERIAGYLSGFFGQNPPSTRQAIKVPLAALAVAILLLIISLASYGRIHDNMIYPGINVGGVSLGHMTSDQARAKLEERLRGYMPVELALTFNGQEWRPTAQDIGLRVDLGETSRGAYSIGRDGFFLQAAAAQVGAFLLGHKAPLILAIDDATLERYVQSLADEIDQPVIEGSVSLEGIEVQATASQEGRKLNISATKESIKNQITSLSRQPLALAVQVTPPQIKNDEITKAQAALATLVGSPLTLRHGSETWLLEPEKIAAMTLITGTGAEKPVEISLNQAQLRQFADDLSGKLMQEERDAVLSWGEDGLTVVTPSKEGRALDVTRTVELINQQAPTTNRDVALPVMVTKPRIPSDDPSALGIKELIGQGQSSFAGSSWSRATNISVASGYLDGAVIPPGETFSFNKAIGEISVERGYVEGLTIQADQTLPGIGGGVCQVSTTVFRAAFWSGLPIVERNQHTYRVGWYEQMGEPVGFDGAIYQPDLDLRFQNTTSSYILVQAVVDGATLTVNLYGTKPNWQVTLDGPYIGSRTPAPPDIVRVDPSLPPGTRNQVDWAVNGIEATIYRIVEQNGEEIRRDTFYSAFRAWPNIYIEGPKAEPSPTPASGTPAPNSTPPSSNSPVSSPTTATTPAQTPTTPPAAATPVPTSPEGTKTP